MSLEAVTFDYWNTLCWEERGHTRALRMDAWAGLLEEAGFACERSLLDAVLPNIWLPRISNPPLFIAFTAPAL